MVAAVGAVAVADDSFVWWRRPSCLPDTNFDTERMTLIDAEMEIAKEKFHESCYVEEQTMFYRTYKSLLCLTGQVSLLNATPGTI